MGEPVTVTVAVFVAVLTGAERANLRHGGLGTAKKPRLRLARIRGMYINLFFMSIRTSLPYETLTGHAPIHFLALCTARRLL